MRNYHIFNFSRATLSINKQNCCKISYTLFIVSNDDVLPLNEDIDKIGESFLKDEKTYKLLQEKFSQKVLPLLKNPLQIYDGIGITNEDISLVLSKFDQDQIIKATKYLKDYKEMINQGNMNGLTKWLGNIEKVNPIVYKHLSELINKENEKNI